MVNQMLDLRKLESGNLPVNLVKGDVVQYLRYLTESFYSDVAGRGVGLHFMTDLNVSEVAYEVGFKDPSFLFPPLYRGVWGDTE